MGGTLNELGRLEEAESIYRKAISLEPDFAEAHNNLGSVLRNQGDLEAAIDSYKKTLKINPDFDAATVNLGEVYFKNGQYEKAKEHFDSLDDQASIAKALECIYFLENFEEFNTAINTVIENDPKNIRVAAISSFASHQLQQKDVYPFCKNPFELLSFGHIKNHVSAPEKLVGEILDEMNMKNSIWELNNTTTKGGFQTKGNLFSKPSRNIATLESIIRKEITSFYSKFETHDSVLIQQWPEQNTLEGWYVRMFENGHQDSHIHSNGWISGVLYLKTVDAPTKNEGAIEFGLHGYSYPIKNENYPKLLHQPSDGELILFPSSLFHRTIPIRKEVERSVIAFDLIGLT
jgi:tetratricopeptide (TPR) repeat protein